MKRMKKVLAAALSLCGILSAGLLARPAWAHISAVSRVPAFQGRGAAASVGAPISRQTSLGFPALPASPLAPALLPAPGVLSAPAIGPSPAPLLTSPLVPVLAPRSSVLPAPRVAVAAGEVPAARGSLLLIEEVLRGAPAGPAAAAVEKASLDRVWEGAAAEPGNGAVAGPSLSEAGGLPPSGPRRGSSVGGRSAASVPYVRGEGRLPGIGGWLASAAALPDKALYWLFTRGNLAARRIVVFHPDTAPDLRLSLVRQAGWTVVRDLWLINAVAVIAPGYRARSLVSGLLSRPEVARVDGDARVNWIPEQPQAAPRRQASAPAHDRAVGWWGQTVPWGVKRVHAQEAWAVTRGAGIKVAVEDSGVDRGHRDLKLVGGFSAVAGEEWFEDGLGHGTHVAGTIAALDNDADVVGVAPGAELYSVKVLDKRGKGTFESVIAGLQWCVEHGMHLVNFSITHPTGNESLVAAVKAAAAAGLVMIAAAGNTAQAVQFPAAYPEVIAVAAATDRNTAADFSSFGPEIDLIAPGVGVRSTLSGGGTGKKSGTSMASPHVTGLAALALAAGRGLLRGVEAVRRALQESATKFADTPDTWQGAGMPDARKLVGL